MSEAKEQKKEITPIEQWDHLAFQVIYNELAPNGFNRGTQYVKVTKKSVVNTQKIAAQLIRGFRNLTLKNIEIYITNRTEHLQVREKQLSECGLLDFYKKRRLRNEISSFKATIAGIEIAKFQVQNTPIK